MMSLLVSMMMFLSPMAAGGNGHHYGWRNQAPRIVPGVTVVTPRGGQGASGNQPPAPGVTPGDPDGMPHTYSE